MPLSYGMPAAGPRCSLGLACTHTPACPRTAPPPSDYYQSKLALEWREWMTRRFTAEYFYDRTFYQVQVRGGVVWCGVVWCGVVWWCLWGVGGVEGKGEARQLPALFSEGAAQGEKLLAAARARHPSPAAALPTPPPTHHCLQAGALVDNPDQRIAVDVR